MYTISTQYLHVIYSVYLRVSTEYLLVSRNHHMGCPVVRGNKWIANKWVKWPDQMWTFPCTRTRGRHLRGFDTLQ